MENQDDPEKIRKIGWKNEKLAEKEVFSENDEKSYHFSDS